METLCAFVRERARWKPKEEASSETVARYYQESETTESRSNPPTDIAAVLAVIVRRDQKSLQRERANGWRLDFHGADLRGAGLTRFGFDRFGFDHFATSFFLSVERPAFGEFLSANLSGATLIWADLSRATLIGADLSGASLIRANLFGADLSGARELSEEQLAKATGDASARLPIGLPRPAHWPEAEP